MKYLTKYTTQLAHGATVIEETLAMLLAYQHGMSNDDFFNVIIENGVLSYTSESRIKHLIYDVFYQRFVKYNPQTATWLKAIREKGLMLDEMSQILMVYCARSNALYYDFITDVLNVYRSDERKVMPRGEIINFIDTLQSNGSINWSESVRKKNAGYISSAMLGFGQYTRKQEVMPVSLTDFVFLYILHDLHFSGISDNGLLEDTDWRLFNMSRNDIAQRILDLSLKGGYIAQYSGELLTISWTYKSMEDFIDGTL